jgi:hypothetical protein
MTLLLLLFVGMNKNIWFSIKIKIIKEQNILIKIKRFVLQNFDSFKRPHLMAYKAAGSPPLF